jgi:hypothetical protein
MVPAASLCTERTENPVQTTAMNIGTHPEGYLWFNAVTPAPYNIS